MNIAPLEVAAACDLWSFLQAAGRRLAGLVFAAMFVCCFFFFITFFSPYLVLVHGCNEKGEGDGSSCHGVGGRHPVLRIRPHLQLHDRWREGTRPLQDVLGDLPYVHHDLGRGNTTGCQPAQGISTLPTPEPRLSELFCCKIHRPKSRAHPVNY